MSATCPACNLEAEEPATRLASPAYARTILREAGKQLANRITVRKKRARGGRQDSQVPVIETAQVGAITPPDYRYVGPSGKIGPSDPHQALIPVVMVETVLMWHPNLTAVFEQVYIRDREDWTRRREHNELIRLIQAEIGFIDAKEDDLALILYRTQRMEERRAKQVQYVLKSRARAATVKR